MKEALNKTVNKFNPSDQGNLIPLLQEFQKTEGYISPATVSKISEHLNISKSHIYGVATFYSQFKFNPPGRNSIKICLGTACHVQGGDFLLNALQMEIGIEPGQTTDDKRFDLERVACLGCCALAPVMRINDEIHSRVSVIKLKEILNKYE